MIDVFGTARIQHTKTGKIYDIDRNDLEFETNGTDERGMGIEIEHRATVEHEQLGELTWNVWEYPVGMLNHNDYNIGKHILLEDFGFGIKHEQPDDDEEYQDRMDEMVGWFYKNYEDPANSIRHNSKEIDYEEKLYDARTVLAEEFSYDTYYIDAVVEFIEENGIEEWSRIYPPKNPLQKELFPDDSLEYINERLNTLIDNAPAPTTDPAFALGNDNRLHIIRPPDNQPVDSQNDLLNELRTITDDLLQSLRGANFHQDLIPIIEKYKEALSGNEISISRLYGRGVRLDKMVRAINRGIEAKELPSLPINTETYLESVHEIHGAYIMSHAKGRSLVQDAADYHQPPEQPEGFKEAVEQFSNNIKNNSALFDERVREHVPNILMDIGKGEHSKRLNQIGETTLTKFVSAIFKGIGKIGVKAIQWITVSAIGESTLGQIAITAGTDFINTVWSFLINNAPLIKTITDYLSSKSSWLESASKFLEYIISMIMGD